MKTTQQSINKLIENTLENTESLFSKQFEINLATFDEVPGFSQFIMPFNIRKMHDGELL